MSTVYKAALCGAIYIKLICFLISLHRSLFRCPVEVDLIANKVPSVNIFQFHHHHHHQVELDRISTALSLHPFRSCTAFGRSSSRPRHPGSSHSKHRDLKGAKMAPLGICQKLMIYMVLGSPFSPKCEKPKSLYLCQYSWYN